jgi:hypothetical protein
VLTVIYHEIISMFCKNDNPGFFTNGIPAMKNPDALRIFFPKFLGGKYNESVPFNVWEQRPE